MRDAAGMPSGARHRALKQDSVRRVGAWSVSYVLGLVHTGIVCLGPGSGKTGAGSPAPGTSGDAVQQPQPWSADRIPI